MRTSPPALHVDESTLLQKNDSNYLVFVTPSDKAVVSGIRSLIFADKDNHDTSQEAEAEFHVRVVYERVPRSLQPMLAISFDPPTPNTSEQKVAQTLRLEEEVTDEEDWSQCTVPELIYTLSKHAKHRMVSASNEVPRSVKRQKLDNSHVRIGNRVLWRVTKTGAPRLLLDIAYSYCHFEHENKVVQLMRMFLDAANMRDVKASEIESTGHA